MRAASSSEPSDRFKARFATAIRNEGVPREGVEETFR